MAKTLPDHFFDKLKQQQETREDHIAFFTWLRSAPEAEIERVLEQYAFYFENLPDEDVIATPVTAGVQPQKNTLLWPSFLKKTAIAACFILVIVISHYFYQEHVAPQKTSSTVQNFSIVPSGKKAVLLLGNGTSILLDAAGKGTIATQNRVRIYKSESGQLVYNDSKFVGESHPLIMNEIHIPKGGEYQLILPDGSKVWMNAQSTLQYPIHFSGKERLVKLTGEAYFEVAKDNKRPFKVMANHTEVKVLGTHFNIMAYHDEAAIKTTLLEGAVQVSSGKSRKLLVPGEQAMVSNQDFKTNPAPAIQVVHVNVEEAVEWKNGNFNFSHEKLPAIMRKLARWYDVSIDYKGKTSTASFVGTIPKSTDIRQVLKYLELTELVHFKITERRIVVMP